MRWHRLLWLGLAILPPLAVAADPVDRPYTIAELRALARSVHPTLDAAEAAIAAARGTLRQASAHPNPELAVALGRGRPRDGGASRAEHTLELAQPIELPGLRRWRERAAALGVERAELERALAATLIDAAVARLAHAVLLAEQELALARRNAEIARELHALVERRVELGESAPLDEVRARVEWFAQRREELDAQAAFSASRQVLATFLDGRLPATWSIASPERDIEEPPVNLLERFRRDNPLLVAAGLATEQAQARLALAREETFSRLELVATHEIELDRKATSFGLALAIPVWNRNRGGLAAVRAEHDRAEAEARAVRTELESELAEALTDHRRARLALHLHAEGWNEAAQRALDIVTFSFEHGEAALLEVLDAQRAWLSVRLDEVRARAALHLARAEIERLIGGPLPQEATDELP